MDGEEARRAWLLMAAGDDRGHAGNAGYDDQFDAYYSWDSNVPNHRNLRQGDPIALWDKQQLLGISVIESISTTQGPKLLSRCPSCRTTRISLRKTARPRYRCTKCHNQFDEPDADVVEVKQYTARYDAAWTSLEGVLEQQEVRSLAMHRGDFNAMRPLDWTALERALRDKRRDRAVDRVAARVDVTWPQGKGLPVDMPQGFGRTLVRVRKGQRQFRQQILQSQGSVCAFTGDAPDRVLEAGHLYSYAQLGTHFEHGGLMLRRDIHRLFDDGMLAVQPSNLTIDVSTDLEPYAQYASLHGRPLVSPMRDVQVEWLAKHWSEHRAA